MLGVGGRGREIVPSCSNIRRVCMQKWGSGLLVEDSALGGTLRLPAAARPHTQTVVVSPGRPTSCHLASQES